VLTDIEFPALPAQARSAFVKLGRRNALAIARLSVAAVVRRGSDGAIAEARLVPGAALPVWKRVTEAEAMLVGQRPTPALLTAAGRKVAEVMIGATGRRWSTEYKEPVIAVLARRALEACCGGSGGGPS
jgi:CO/xanthine dehydrogenase FAD-binding subunit